MIVWLRMRIWTPAFRVERFVFADVAVSATMPATHWPGPDMRRRHLHGERDVLDLPGASRTDGCASFTQAPACTGLLSVR